MKKLLTVLVMAGAVNAAAANEYGEETLSYDDYVDTYYADTTPIEPVAPVVSSGTGRRDNYVGLRIQKNERIAFDYAVDGGMNTTVREDNFAFGLTLGNKLTDFIKIEYETAYMGTDFSKRGIDFDYSIWSNMLNVYMFQEFGGAVAPYAGIGVGLAGIWADVSGLDSNTYFDLTWQVMLGVNFALNDRVDLNLGVKYQNYGKVEHESDSGAKATTTIDATAVYLGAAYKFSL